MLVTMHGSNFKAFLLIMPIKAAATVPVDCPIQFGVRLAEKAAMHNMVIIR